MAGFISATLPLNDPVSHHCSLQSCKTWSLRWVSNVLWKPF